MLAHNSVCLAILLPESDSKISKLTLLLEKNSPMNWTSKQVWGMLELYMFTYKLLYCSNLECL